MKTNHPESDNLFRIAALLVLIIAAPIGCTTTRVEEKPTSATDPAQLAREMIGTWVQVGRPGQVGEPPAKGGRYKSRTGTHWNITTADPESGLVTEHFGGSYTLNGNEYVETQTYADSVWLRDNGKSFKFTVQVEGDFMTQFGVDNPYTEVWKRVR